MSNSDTLRTGYDAFARQDIPTVLAMFAPDIDWTTPVTVTHGGHFSGHDGVVQFFMSLGQAYVELRVEPQEFLESGDTVVVLGRHVGKGAGGDFEVPFAHVWRFKDGKAGNFMEYFDTTPVNKALTA